MTTRFTLLAGAQHHLPDAVIGLFSVGQVDGQPWALVGVGRPGDRQQAKLAVGQDLSLDGWGRLRLLDVHLGDSPARRAAAFEFEPVADAAGVEA
ncbi:MAG: hypothetical protein LBJ44_06010 [Propionibacteriaceae bacterium]|jgi:hypothetical protein|nr:hypothetical protein [Propionibacteriaceae bacterium]